MAEPQSFEVNFKTVLAFVVVTIGYAASSTWWAAALATRVEVNTVRISTLEVQLAESRADRRALDSRLSVQEQFNRAQSDALTRIQQMLDAHVTESRQPAPPR